MPGVFVAGEGDQKTQRHERGPASVWVTSKRADRSARPWRYPQHQPQRVAPLTAPTPSATISMIPSAIPSPMGTATSRFGPSAAIMARLGEEVVQGGLGPHPQDVVDTAPQNHRGDASRSCIAPAGHRTASTSDHGSLRPNAVLKPNAGVPLSGSAQLRRGGLELRRTEEA